MDSYSDHISTDDDADLLTYEQERLSSEQCTDQRILQTDHTEQRSVHRTDSHRFLEPMRRLRVNSSSHHPPPKRFYRTFWRSLAKRALLNFMD